MRGTGTHGYGARKKHQGSGHRGGFGMAGTGKRADHKKSLVIKLYGSGYFGKQGITSKSTQKKVNKVMNVGFIEANLDSLLKKFGKDGVIVLEGYKILGDGEISSAVKIKVEKISESAKEKIEKAGGKIILPEVKETIKKEIKKETVKK